MPGFRKQNFRMTDVSRTNPPATDYTVAVRDNVYRHDPPGVTAPPPGWVQVPKKNPRVGFSFIAPDGTTFGNGEAWGHESEATLYLKTKRWKISREVRAKLPDYLHAQYELLRRGFVRAASCDAYQVWDFSFVTPTQQLRMEKATVFCGSTSYLLEDRNGSYTYIDIIPTQNPYKRNPVGDPCAYCGTPLVIIAGSLDCPKCSGSGRSQRIYSGPIINLEISPDSRELKVTLSTADPDEINDLKQHRDKHGIDSALAYAFEYQVGNGWAWLTEEEIAQIGGLTSAPVITNEDLRDEDGTLIDVGHLYWNPNYAVRDDIEDLLTDGYFVWRCACNACNTRPNPIGDPCAYCGTPLALINNQLDCPKCSGVANQSPYIPKYVSQVFIDAYFECALWSSNDDDGDPLDKHYNVADIDPQSYDQQVREMDNFVEQNEPLLGQAGDDSQNGHDFWLTRNGHGSGFWDRGYPDDVSKKLTGASHRFGEVGIYVGDDGKIYISSHGHQPKKNPSRPYKGYWSPSKGACYYCWAPAGQPCVVGCPADKEHVISQQRLTQRTERHPDAIDVIFAACASHTTRNSRTRPIGDTRWSTPLDATGVIVVMRDPQIRDIAFVGRGFILRTQLSALDIIQSAERETTARSYFVHPTEPDVEAFAGSDPEAALGSAKRARFYLPVSSDPSIDTPALFVFHDDIQSIDHFDLGTAAPVVRQMAGSDWMLSTMFR